jgi:hypothetical protein
LATITRSLPAETSDRSSWMPWMVINSVPSALPVSATPPKSSVLASSCAVVGGITATYRRAHHFDRVTVAPDSADRSTTSSNRPLVAASVTLTISTFFSVSVATFVPAHPPSSPPSAARLIRHRQRRPRRHVLSVDHAVVVDLL